MKPSLLICQAIQEHRVLKLIYDSKTRLVEPYIFGLSSNGKILLSGYQIQNLSDPAIEAGWRTFEFERLESIELTPRHFRQGHGYNPEDRTFKEVVSRV